MTNRQRQIAQAVLDYTWANGEPPFPREVCELMHVPKRTLKRDIGDLIRQGYLKRDGFPSSPQQTLQVVGARDLVPTPGRILWRQMCGKLVYCPENVG